MGIGIGLDIGSTTTKIAARTRGGELLAAEKFEGGATGLNVTEVVEKFARGAGISLSSLRGVSLTGVGATRSAGEFMGRRMAVAEEFYAIARGGLLMTGRERAIVLSMGTGTAIVKADGEDAARFGGSGVGGGTLVGLSRVMFGVGDFKEIKALSLRGDLGNVDLKIRDLFSDGYIGLNGDLTLANFARAEDGAKREDVILGLVNMIFEAAGVMAGLACRGAGMDAVVVIGSMVELPQAAGVFSRFAEQTGLSYEVAPNGQFATALGAAGVLWEGERTARLSRVGK